MSEIPKPKEIKVGDRVKSHLGDSVIINIDPPQVAQVIPYEAGEALHPVASTLGPDEQIMHVRPKESWPPERVSWALIEGHEPAEYPRPSLEKQREIEGKIKQEYEKGRIVHPPELSHN